MGEDSCRNNVTDKKPTTIENHITNGIHNNMNGSAISSCSEADSESTTCVGDVEEHTFDEQDLQYGPGIVSKLRTKFLSISLKQHRCGINNMRRSCSLENILDQKSAMSPTNIFSSSCRFGPSGESKSSLINPSWSNLKRAKSMDTLLLSVTEEQSKTVNNDVCTTPEIGSADRVPKMIRKKDGPLTRTTLTICDEELPKPDTVKTYKRMFEPAESKKTSTSSNVRRRPPVLRATAKSGSISTNKSTGSSGKMNGILPNSLPAVKSNPVTSKCKQSAKESNISKECSLKMISNASKNEFKTLEENRNLTKNSINLKKEVPIVNGLVKAEPVKFKQRDESLKRNFRVHKNLDGERNLKPAVPANKPLIHPKTINTIAQLLEKRNSMDKTRPIIPKQIVSKTEKIILKPIIAKHVEKPVNLNNKLEHNQNSVSNEINSTIVKPIVENGIPPVQQEFITAVHQQNIIKEESSQPILNGFSTPDVPDSTAISEQPQKHLVTPKNDVPPNPLILQNGDGHKEAIPPRKVNSVKSSSIANNNNSMVFDFRGKDVEAHLAIIPAPFGCRKAIPAASKKRSVLLDGKEPYALNGFSNGDTIGTDEDDDDFMDYSMPQPCGLVFEGENIRVGKGAILAIRNKDLKIQFDEDVEKSTFVYPSESSYLSDDSSSMSSDFSSLEDNCAKLTNGVLPTTAKLRANTAIGSNAALQAQGNCGYAIAKLVLRHQIHINCGTYIFNIIAKQNNISMFYVSRAGVGGLMSYTPSVLRTVDNFQPGIFRPPEKDDQKLKDKKDGDEGEEENRERKEQEQNGVADDSEQNSAMLKPADPEFISSWSLSANTSDLLF